MIIKIEPQSNIPIYAQLTNQIMEGIIRGELKDGDMLPSVRSLAADLSINMHTVNKSYHELEEKGIIKIVPKSGAIICLQKSWQEKERYQQLVDQFRPVIVEALVLGMNKEDLYKLVNDISSVVEGE
ncbi:GntR family transcriptional regulator [Niallia sp. 01092]|uniref:GntR family transcriptional regulator n=1 Tax=unclassified Niallia TaxID=2837522 RepID=UPI003FD392B0